LGFPVIQVDGSRTFETRDSLVRTGIVHSGDDNIFPAPDAFFDRAPILIRHEHLFHVRPESTARGRTLHRVLTRLLINDGYVISMQAQFEQTAPGILSGVPGLKNSNNLSRIHDSSPYE
jgi:hypothetical protein